MNTQYTAIIVAVACLLVVGLYVSRSWFSKDQHKGDRTDTDSPQTLISRYNFSKDDSDSKAPAAVATTTTTTTDDTQHHEESRPQEAEYVHQDILFTPLSELFG